MLAQHRVDARLRVVDEHIISEVEHRLDPLVATFGDAPEWHNKPGGQVMKGHREIRDFYAANQEDTSRAADFVIDAGSTTPNSASPKPHRLVATAPALGGMPTSTTKAPRRPPGMSG